MAPAPALVLPDVVAGEGRGLLSLALDPAFAENGRVYVIYTADTGFRLARFRLVGDVLGERAVILDGVETGAQAGAAIRFGTDGRLYLGLDDAGDARLAEDLGSYSGKVLRLNPDGTTPSDQAGGTPVFATELNQPGGLAWNPEGATLWTADADPDGAERLQGAVLEAAGRRARMAVRYTLPEGLGASGLTFYWNAAIPAFHGNLLVAASDADAILRVRFEKPESSTITGTEWIFRGRLGSVRAIATGPDGRIYVCTADALLQLAPEG
jgi:glucose/arabinose dehydrogenase